MSTCILTIIKNEYLYLDEWIKYHLDIGIDHLFIFEDIDSDSHKSITDKYGDKVSLSNISSLFNSDEIKKALEFKITRKINPHNIYLRKALTYLNNNFKGKYDWVFVIDNDEFVTLEPSVGHLSDVLSLYKNYDAIIIQWKCYGANGIINTPDYTKKGVIDIYTEEMKGHIPAKKRVADFKTCYNLNTYRDEFFWYVHQPSDKCNFCKTDFDKNRYKSVYKNLYLRHYITRSWEEFVWKRKTRGFLWGGPERELEVFFVMNPDMNDKKEDLLKNV